MQELEYPFDSEEILKRSKKIKRKLLEERSDFLNKKIAVLGGVPPMILSECWKFFSWTRGYEQSFMSLSMHSTGRM